MKLFFTAVVSALLISGCATKSAATMTLRQGNNTLTLTSAECSPVVANLLKPEVAAKFRHAVAVVGVQQFSACWIMHDDANVYVHFEDGDSALLPLNLFLNIAKIQKPKEADWRLSA